MVTKTIQHDGYNRAIIQKIYENGDVVATVQQVEPVNETEEPALDGGENPSEKIIRQDSNIVFKSGYFEFSDEELEELNPKQVVNELIEN